MKGDRLKIVTSLREKLSSIKNTLDVEEMDEDSIASIEQDLTTNRIRQYEEEIASLTEKKVDITIRE